MIRLFRKYKKVIILVGLPILLVIFLIPGAIHEIGNYTARRGRTVATFTSLTGEQVKVNTVQLEEAQRDVAVLMKGLPFPPGLLLQIGTIDRPEHWILLLHEARAHGLVGGPDDARLAAEQLAEQLAGATGQEQPMPWEDMVRQLANGAGVNGGAVMQALTNARAVRRLLDLYIGSSRLSDARLRQTAERLLQGIDARITVVAADPARETDLPEPTEEQLLSHFEKYRDVAPGAGEHGFGYRLDNRVRLEWLAIPADRVRTNLNRDDRIDRLELRKYWVRNKAQFPVPGAPATHEPTFEEVEQRVREAYVREQAEARIAEMTRFVEAEVARRLRDLKRDGVYYVLPEDWADRRLKLHEMADQISNEFGLGTPDYVRRADVWFTANELAALPGIGGATTERFGRAMRLSDLVPALKEFGGSPEITLQTGVIGPVLRGRDGSVYFFRIIESDAARAPTSIDEVRDRVAADLKRLAAYERLIARSEALRAEAVSLGIDRFARVRDTVAIPYRNIGYAPQDTQLVQTYRRNNTELLPPVGRDEKVLNAIVEKGRELLRRLLTDRRTMEDLTLDDLTFVVPADDRLAVVVGQFTDLRPLVREEMALYTMPVMELIVREEMGERGADVFSFESMRKRYHLDLGADGEPDTEADGEPVAG